MITVTPAEIEARAFSALVAHGATRENAVPVARAIARAEAEGNAVCGLFYLPIFCAHLDCGKVDGKVLPDVALEQAVVSVDARSGFAHPAIAAGMPPLIDTARRLGIASMPVRNSYNCLALGHHVTPLAEAGLIGICLSNAPASVAPPGAKSRLFGTNPIAFAVPVANERPIVVDQSMSAVTKTEMILRKDRGEEIPPAWAQDRHGNATTDPATGLDGSILPAGGRKGANIALLIEVLCAALTGSSLSMAASGFSDDAGGPPRIGQFLLAIDPAHYRAGEFAGLVSRLIDEHEAAGLRLPGRSHTPAGKVEVNPDLWQKVVLLS